MFLPKEVTKKDGAVAIGMEINMGSVDIRAAIGPITAIRTMVSIGVCKLVTVAIV